MLNNLIGTKFKVVSGYPGTREIILALEKGEVSGVCAISLAPWRCNGRNGWKAVFIRRSRRTMRKVILP